MLNNKEFQAEEKYCADILGMSLEEYRNYVKNVKVPAKEKKSTKLNTIIQF